MVGTLQPLGTAFPITNPDGTPTAYFTRWAQARQIDIGTAVSMTQLVAYIDGLVVKGVSPIVVTGKLDTGLTISLHDSGVTAGSYTNPAISVDEFGRIVSASSGPAPLPDAPADGHTYGRNNNAWVVVTSGGSGIPDAPSDGHLYGRENGAWMVVPAPGISDAPTDGNQYVRKNGAWVVFTPPPVTGGILPIVLDAEIPPTFVQLPDGNLVYGVPR